MNKDATVEVVRFVRSMAGSEGKRGFEKMMAPTLHADLWGRLSIIQAFSYANFALAKAEELGWYPATFEKSDWWLSGPGVDSVRASTSAESKLTISDLMKPKPAVYSGDAYHVCAFCHYRWESPDPPSPFEHCGDCHREFLALKAASSADGCALIVAERERQKTVEDWTPEHDDTHDHGEMVIAAARYALHDVPVVTSETRQALTVLWRWASCWWKPKDRIRNLVRAGALIAAEIDRLLRSETPAHTGEQK